MSAAHPHLHVVTDQSARGQRREPVLLQCYHSRVFVTVTHRVFGTMLVAEAAYRQFCEIGLRSKLLIRHLDDRASIVWRMSEAFACSQKSRQLDKRGNWLFFDNEERMLFVVNQHPSTIVAVYDRSQPPAR